MPIDPVEANVAVPDRIPYAVARETSHMSYPRRDQDCFRHREASPCARPGRTPVTHRSPLIVHSDAAAVKCIYVAVARPGAVAGHNPVVICRPGGQARQCFVDRHPGGTGTDRRGALSLVAPARVGLRSHSNHPSVASPLVKTLTVQDRPGRADGTRGKRRATVGAAPTVKLRMGLPLAVPGTVAGDHPVVIRRPGDQPRQRGVDCDGFRAGADRLVRRAGGAGKGRTRTVLEPRLRRQPVGGDAPVQGRRGRADLVAARLATAGAPPGVKLRMVPLVFPELLPATTR